MRDLNKKLVLAVPLGLKKWFTREARSGNVVPFQKVNFIDPTHPGEETCIAAMNGELDGNMGYEYCDGPPPEQLQKDGKKPDLRLV